MRGVCRAALLCMLPRLIACMTVHLLPHAHVDVGWKKTPEQYYWGANQSIVQAGVRWTLDSVLLALEAYPARRFQWVEIFFFSRWWNLQSAATQARMRVVVEERRLVFAGGGFVMADSAVTLYSDMISQTSMGHAFIASVFGEAYLPTTTFQCDPFGHSVVQASLLSPLAGMPSLFVGRIDWQDKAVRVNESTLEMWWTGSPSLGASAVSFTNVLDNLYFPPGGFCWDLPGCADTPIIDDPASEEYNAPSIAAAFAAAMTTQASHYRGSHILVTMGLDFAYQAANQYFTSIDKLIAAVNSNASLGFQLQYSSLADYAAAKLAEVASGDITLPVKEYDDWFP